jgi:CRP/FNR family transcriptional regulator/CRP/FNR family cyclic AMP-dependent transcriptional regulator
MAAPVELLRKVSMFGGLEDAELNAIAAIAQRKRYGSRETVVQQADAGGELFVIVSGHLKVVSAGTDGRDNALNVMGPGEVFGEISLLDGEPRSATVTSLDRCELLIIRRDPFMRLLESSARMSIELLKVLTKRVRKLTERSEDIAFLRVGGRLAKRVAELADAYGEKLPDGSLRLPFKLSQQEIGDLVNATRESANKQIKQWEDEGLVAQDSGYLVVRDLQRLKAQGGEI